MSRLAAGVAAGLLLAGCQAEAALPSPAPLPAVVTPATTAQPAATPQLTTVPTTATPTPTPTPSTTPTPTPAETKPPKDTRKGAALAKPYTVNGIVVVSPKHPVSRAYQPRHPGKYGVEKEVASALATMIAAAKADGVRLVVRSGYRSYAEQSAILKRKIVEYGNEELARRYNAEPGKSEHQTGLAVDLWDGSTWGLGFRNTKAGKWLWKHSREYGFILRYPPDKEKLTGYAYEPWHFRYIGVEDSLNFKANTKLTLEEYLGLA